MRTRTTITALLAALLLALPATSALANGADDHIVQDCQHSDTGALTGSYTKAQLKHALHNLPGDVLEYSGCYDAIRQGLLATVAGNGGGGGNGGDGSGAGPIGGAGGGYASGGATGGTAGGSAPAGPEHVGTEAPVKVAGTPVEPGELPSIGQDAHELPKPLLALLVLLGIAALVPAGLTIGRRVVARRRA